MDDKEVFAALAAALKPMNTTKDIADNCGIKEGTLAYWRSAGGRGGCVSVMTDNNWRTDTPVA